MISMIRGKIIGEGKDFLIIENNNLGYKVFVLNDLLLFKKEEISLWTYLAVRENALDLYGFSDQIEMAFFEKLISVPSIGPRSALGVMNLASVNILKKAIVNNDLVYLTKVSGIGRKTAEKIILTLRDKFDKDESINLQDELDVLGALQSLGYNQQEAREVLKKVDKEKNTNDKIKEALKLLSKN